MCNNSILFPRHSCTKKVLSTLKYLYSLCEQSSQREYVKKSCVFISSWVIFNLILQVCMNISSFVYIKFASYSSSMK